MYTSYILTVCALIAVAVAAPVTGGHAGSEVARDALPQVTSLPSNSLLGGGLDLVSPQVVDTGLQDVSQLGSDGPGDVEYIVEGALDPEAHSEKRQLSGEIFDFIATKVVEGVTLPTDI